jgi:hypothetical protein
MQSISVSDAARELQIEASIRHAVHGIGVFAICLKMDRRAARYPVDVKAILERMAVMELAWKHRLPGIVLSTGRMLWKST